MAISNLRGLQRLPSPIYLEVPDSGTDGAHKREGGGELEARRE